MTSNASQGLSDDVIFDIMSNRRRRFVLRYLQNEGEPAQLTDIATALAAVESDTTPGEVDRQARKRAYVSLYQTHVPRLAEEQVVEYDADAGTVSLRDPAEELLDQVGRGESADRWPSVYFLLGLAGLVIHLLLGVMADRLLLVGVLVPLGVLVVSLLHWRKLPRQSWEHEFQ